MGPAARTTLGILTGLVVFLAMALLGVIAVNGVNIPSSRVEPSAAGGASATLDPPVLQEDVNRDGFLSLAEAAGSEHLVTRFGRADRNKDGKLSKAEYQRLEKLPPSKAKKTRDVKDSVRRHARAAAAAANH
jgi:hypothetical protein